MPSRASQPLKIYFMFSIYKGTYQLVFTLGLPHHPVEEPLAATGASPRNCHRLLLPHQATPAACRAAMRCTLHCYLKLVPIATMQPHTLASTIASACWQPLVRTSTV